MLLAMASLNNYIMHSLFLFSVHCLNMEGMKTSAIAISLAVLLAAFYYKQSNDEELRNHLENTLSGLLRAEQKANINPQTKVAVGFGACSDIFTDGMKVLDGINATAPDIPEHVNKIVTREDLEKIFGYFFEHGAAAE